MLLAVGLCLTTVQGWKLVIQPAALMQSGLFLLVNVKLVCSEERCSHTVKPRQSELLCGRMPSYTELDGLYQVRETVGSGMSEESNQLKKMLLCFSLNYV